MPYPMDAILSRISEGNRRRQENALNEIFAKSYEPGAAVPFVDEGAQAFGLAQEPGMVSGYEPGRINPQNALSQMAQSKEPGFALRAFELQKQMEDRDLERRKVAAQYNRDTAAKSPMSVEETKWFLKQSPEDQKQHVMLKRAQQIIDTGRDFRTLNQIDPTQTNIVAQRSFKPTEELGYVGNKEATEKTSTANVERGTKLLAKKTDAKDVLDILDMADQYVDKSTGSLSGSVRDSMAGTMGISTEGAQASAQLKVLGGTLVSKMPKMSGPQSDKDVLLYKEMAGQIGDPTIPNETKKAAMRAIRMINEKYQDQNQIEYAGVNDVTNAPREAKKTTYKVNGITKGPDGRTYLIRSLKPDGTPDEVIPAK